MLSDDSDEQEVLFFLREIHVLNSVKLTSISIHNS